MGSNQKARELVDKLSRDLEEFRTSEEWARHLDTVARFHGYSPRNRLLIALQNSGATYVAGYRKWQTMGRQVQKGQKAIWILAPMTGKDKDDPDRVILFGFKAVPVFDISQTEGDPLPIVRPEKLTGPGIPGAIDRVTAVIRSRGYSVEFDRDLGSANGVTIPAQKAVRIAGGMSPGQVLKTLIHELAHVDLHADDIGTLDRPAAECEAESVAYVVGQAIGLETETYSLAYVAGWYGDRPLIEVAETIINAADKIMREVTSGN